MQAHNEPCTTHTTTSTAMTTLLAAPALQVFIVRASSYCCTLPAASLDPTSTSGGLCICRICVECSLMLGCTRNGTSNCRFRFQRSTPASVSTADRHTGFSEDRQPVDSCPGMLKSSNKHSAGSKATTAAASQNPHCAGTPKSKSSGNICWAVAVNSRSTCGFG